MTLSDSEASQLPIVESCEGCGACCKQTAVPPYVLVDGVHEGLIRKVPDQLLADIMPYWEIRLDLPERPCMWFDAEKNCCKHYDHRPQACRDFELNSTICHAVRQRWDLE